MNILQNIGQFIAGAGLLLGSWFGYHQPQNLGVTVNKPVPRFESSLALAINATATSSLTMISGVDGNGDVLSGPMCFTIDGGTTSLVEDVCGVASGTIVTNLVRGMDSDGTTSNPSLAHSHRVGADVKTTDSPYLVQFYRLLNGIDAFPNVLQYASNVTNASITANPLGLVSEQLLASTSFAGVVNGSYNQKGIFQEATTSTIASGTAIGSSGADLVLSQNTASTSCPQYSVAETNASGTLNPCFFANQNYSLGSTTVQSLTSASTTLNGTTNVSNLILGTPLLGTQLQNKVYASGTTANFTGNTSIVSGTQMFSIAIPSSTVSSTNVIDVSVLGAFTGANVADSGVVNFLYGNTNLVTSTVFVHNATVQGRMDFYLFATGTSTQTGILSYNISSSTQIIGDYQMGTSAQSNTSTQPLIMRVKFSGNGSSSDTAAINGLLISSFQNNF